MLVGGGLANASLLLHAAQGAREWAGSLDGPLEILIVDRTGERGGGVAYGRGTHPALLMNDPVGRIDGAALEFGRWLGEERETWINFLQRSEDPRVRAWLVLHAAELERADFAKLFMPRVLFGQCLRDRVAHAIARLEHESRGRVRVHALSAEASALSPRRGGGFVIRLDGGAEDIEADVVVLGIGHLSKASRLGAAERLIPGRLQGKLSGLENVVSRALTGNAAGQRRIVIAGSAATATEFLFSLERALRATASLEEIVVIAPSGSLPAGAAMRPGDPFVAREVQRTFAKAHSTAAALFRAIARDVARARAAGHSSVDFGGEVQRECSRAFDRLDAREKRTFVELYGRRMRALIRRTPQDYDDAINRLVARTHLRVIAGSVTSVSLAANDGPLVRARTVDGSELRLRCALVVDCTGFGDLVDFESALVSDLLARKLIRPNHSRQGIDVNEDFEAAPGLIVNGALLTGLSRGDDHIWHLDSIPRLLSLSQRIWLTAQTRLVGPHRPIDSSRESAAVPAQLRSAQPASARGGASSGAARRRAIRGARRTYGH